MVAPHSAGARTASTLRPGYWDRLVLEKFWRTVVECNEMLIRINCIFSFFNLPTLSDSLPCRPQTTAQLYPRSTPIVLIGLRFSYVHREKQCH